MEENSKEIEVTNGTWDKESVSSFSINRHLIASVAVENQNEELRALGLTVYDQSKFEEEVLRQVDDAIGHQERRKNLNRAQAAAETLPANANVKDEGKPGGKLVPLTIVQCENESESEKLVRLGHMTPFGSVLNSGKVCELSSFEKYLSQQEKLRSEKLKQLSKKKCAARPLNTTPGLSTRAAAKQGTTSCNKNNETDSDYIPSDGECHSRLPNHMAVRRKRGKSTRELTKELTPRGSAKTDDSEWEYSEDEDTSSKRKKKKLSGRVVDDGNLDDYHQRLAGISTEEHTRFKEFEGGYRISLTIWDQLFDYQKVGVRWMYELHVQRCGGILGDEMGLGKTIQVIAFLAGLVDSKLVSRQSNHKGLGPVLLVTPATVMHQWVKEFHKWAPRLRIAILHESGSHLGSRTDLIKSVNKTKGVLLASYAGIVNCSESLLELEWDYVILDEGHKIRNPDAQVTLFLKQFRTCHRLILSGSPMQNNLKELWSLFDFIFPGKLGTLPTFLQQFAVPITQGGYSNASQVQVATAYKCATVLKETINPYLLRRMKSDVKAHLQLPDKNEQVLFCRLTEHQRKMYQTYLDSAEIKSIMNGRLQIFVGLTNLRKICNHPDLFVKCAKNESTFVERSGKMLVIDSLLRIWKEQNHRCLLFSQSRKMLNMLESFVAQQNYTYLRLDGTTGVGSRQPMIERFNKDANIFVFLLTTRVGGLGVNLTGADRVIIYDPDWNPCTDTQARERSWRIGQTRNVTVYRLLTSGTIEEKIYHRQIFKQYLTNRVLKDPKQRRFFKSNDLHELFTLNETDSQCTETEAIFAGTSSEVATNPNEATGRWKENRNKASDADWMSQWRREREKRESEWKKTLERERRKKELKALSVEERRARKKIEAKARKEKKKISIDGSRVKHVVKVANYQPPAAETDHTSTTSSTDQDDYVLQRLFAKTGVMSAIRHDSLVDAGNPDYALVEGEAERVAKQAIQELKNSRRSCFRAEAGIPTWTGISGTVPPSGSVEKPRFGAKKNSNPVVSDSPSDFVAESTSNTSSFNGITLPGCSTGALSSQELMNRMQARNRLLGLPVLGKDESLHSVNDEETLILSSKSIPLEFATGVDFRTIMDDIRSYVAFRGPIPGQVSTDDILNEFNGKLPPRSVPLFRALLNQLCSFTRDTQGKGLWQLKSDLK